MSRQFAVLRLPAGLTRAERLILADLVSGWASDVQKGVDLGGTQITFWLPEPPSVTDEL